MAASSRFHREISVITIIVTACCSQSDRTLYAISITAISTFSSRLRKLQEKSIKSGGDLEEVGNRMVAKPSINTCNRWLENCKQNRYKFLYNLRVSNFLPQLFKILEVEAQKITACKLTPIGANRALAHAVC